jgi:hypothetical protein
MESIGEVEPPEPAGISGVLRISPRTSVRSGEVGAVTSVSLIGNESAVPGTRLAINFDFTILPAESQNSSWTSHGETGVVAGVGLRLTTLSCAVWLAASPTIPVETAEKKVGVVLVWPNRQAPVSRIQADRYLMKTFLLRGRLGRTRRNPPLSI